MNRGSRRLVQVGIGTVLGLLSVGLLSWPALRADRQEDEPRVPLVVGADVSLIGPEGQPTSLGSFQGKWVLLFFGFANCPDVCPVTLERVHAGLAELARRGPPEPPLTVVMVTVDPTRDTPAALELYLAPYGAAFVGLTGEPGNLSALASDFGVVVQAPSAADHASHTSAPTGVASTEISHTARIFVLDPVGRWIDEIPPWPGATDMADAIAAVVGMPAS